MSEEAERVYTINLGKVLLSQSQHRAVRAINMIKEFARHHMKVESIKIEEDLAHKIWKRGVRSPPRKIKVRMSKTDEGHILVSQYDEDMEPKVIPETKAPEPADSLESPKPETEAEAPKDAPESPKPETEAEAPKDAPESPKPETEAESHKAPKDKHKTLEPKESPEGNPSKEPPAKEEPAEESAKKSKE